MVTACEHEWRWLGSVYGVRSRDGQVTEYHNAECDRCGLRAWKHGNMPNRGTVYVAPDPTTERS